MITPAKAGHSVTPMRSQLAPVRSHGRRAIGGTQSASDQPSGENIDSRKQRGQLAAGERPPVAEGRLLRPGPDAAAIGNHQDDAAARREDPPDLAQLLARIVRHFEAVDHQHALDRRIRQRQRIGGDEGGGVQAVRRPVHHPLARRHEGDGAGGAVGEAGEIGRRVADAEKLLAGERRPVLPEPRADQPARRSRRAARRKRP